MKGIIYLEDGSIFEGKGLGHKGTCVGEIVFNTSMSGYQELITDPSSNGQIITMTYPLIGNYGINSEFNESKGVYAKGLIVKSICKEPSNFMGIEEMDTMLSQNEVVVVEDVDTRSITRIIREKGAQKCVISTEEITKEEAQSLINSFVPQEDTMKTIGTKENYEIKGNGKNVVAIDLGTRGSVLKALNQKGCNITVVPYSYGFDEIMNLNPDGVFLTDGPGNPKKAEEAIETIKKIIDSNIPVFGVGLGHEIIALSQGADVYKLKYGHRGSNHGVKDIVNEKCFIISQSHSYAVCEKSLEGKDVLVSHINLNDETVEGIKHKSKPVFSVQFLPEGEPGPSDTDYLINDFIKYMGMEG